MSPRKKKTSSGRAAARSQSLRCGFLSCATVILGLAMGARAFQLQVVQGSAWRDLAVSQTTETRELPAARGGIFDRHGRPLAVSRENYAAFFAPTEATDRAESVDRIRRVLDLTSRETTRLEDGRSGWLALGHVDGRTRQMLEQAVPRGVHFEPIAARAHPEGRLAGQLLGSLDSEGRGATGLERVLDEMLTGTPGEEVSRRDAHGATFPLRHAGGVAARPGRDVVLTIDAELQEIAEASLSRALTESGASGGDVILADPRTGEILALASVTTGGEARIPAFTDPYEPGSTTKPVLLATLLQNNLADLDEEIYVEGGTYKTPYRTITDVHGYDSLTVEEIIRYSSNIGAAKLAERIPEAGLQYSFLRDFGFGTPTLIESGSESAGVLRRPESWSPLSRHSLAYGYEMTVTSIQLVAAYGALANDGVLLQPTLIRSVRDADGAVIQRHQPRVLRRVVDAEVAHEITRVLAGVVRSGTGDEAALQTIDIAGKTGTSRISAEGAYQAGRYVASFVGYLPADDPQLVVLAKLSDPKSSIYGGGVAAPVSRTVVQAILSAAESGLVAGRVVSSTGSPYDWDDAFATEPNEETVEPTPFRFATAEAVRDAGQAEVSGGTVVLPDLRGLGLREAVARLHELGLAVDNEAGGRVEATTPGPGARVVSGARILLH